MLLWVALAGCQQDLVLAMGDLTGVAAAASRGDAAPVAIEAPPIFELRRDQPDIVAVPLGTDASDGGVGGAARLQEASGVSGARSGRDFNPISVPQGPIENTGVSFDGVSSKTTPTMHGAGTTNEFRRNRR